MTTTMGGKSGSNLRAEQLSSLIERVTFHSDECGFQIEWYERLSCLGQNDPATKGTSRADPGGQDSRIGTGRYMLSGYGRRAHFA